MLEDSNVRSFHLEAGNEIPDVKTQGLLKREISFRGGKRFFQAIVLVFQLTLGQCLCGDVTVHGLILIAVGLVIDLLVYERREGIVRPMDWLFALARIGLAVSPML